MSNAIAIVAAQPVSTELGVLFTQFVQGGAVNQRPIFHLNRNGLNVEALLQYKTDLTPLGSIFGSSKTIESISFDWSKLPNMNIYQLIGIYSLYVYTMNCLYNRGRKVYPIKEGKSVIGWTHHKVLDYVASNSILNEYSYSLNDVLFLQEAFNACCSFKGGDFQVEAITSKAWFRKSSNFPFANLFSEFYFSRLNKEYAYSPSDFMFTLKQINYAYDRKGSFKALTVDQFVDVVADCQKLYCDNDVFLELIKGSEYSSNYSVYLASLVGDDVVYDDLSDRYRNIVVSIAEFLLDRKFPTPELLAQEFHILSQSLLLKRHFLEGDSDIQRLEDIHSLNEALRLHREYCEFMCDGDYVS